MRKTTLVQVGRRLVAWAGDKVQPPRPEFLESLQDEVLGAGLISLESSMERGVSAADARRAAICQMREVVGWAMERWQTPR